MRVARRVRVNAEPSKNIKHDNRRSNMKPSREPWRLTVMKLALAVIVWLTIALVVGYCCAVIVAAL